MYVYVIYIYRERERERDTYCVYIYIYIYMVCVYTYLHTQSANITDRTHNLTEKLRTALTEKSPKHLDICSPSGWSGPLSWCCTAPP